MQLLEPERRPRVDLSRVLGRVRDGLLRDNKVLPPVLGALALIVFAWILAGALIGNPSNQTGRQAANQADQSSGGVAQNPDDNGSGVGLDAENRDAESFSQFESKNPFGEPPGVGPAEEGESGGTDGTQDDGGDDAGTGDDGTGGDQYGGEDDGGGGSDDGGGGGGGEDFFDQTFPNGQDSGGSNDGGSGGGGGGSGDDLFDSGGRQGR